MGFGISDEVMEKIRDSLWFDPGLSPAVGRITTPPTYSPRRTQNRPSPTQFYYPSETRAATPTYTALTDQEIFLASTYYAIRSAIDKERLKSEIIADRVKQLIEYYSKLFQIINLNPEKVLAAAKRQYDNSAGGFLMGSIVDGILRLFDSPNFSKPDFRDTLDDLFYMANSWSITPPGVSNRSYYFFSYVKRVYGLRQSEFFCCPYCGEPLIKGIAFCPNCLENSRDTLTPRYHPNLRTISDTALVVEHKHPDKSDDDSNAGQLKKAEEEKWELSKRLEELSVAHTEQIAENAKQVGELSATVEKLKKLLSDRDKSIAELLRQLNEDKRQSEEPQKKRILVFGASTIPTEELQEIAEEVGLADVDMVFQTEYVKLKQYAARIKKDSSLVGIVLGPVPHKIKEESGSTSPTAYFSGAGFPFVVEAKTYSGQLKITRQSARMAFAVMFQHLLSAGFYM